MPTFAGLLKLTDKGRENIKESNERREQGLQLLESYGGEVKALYYANSQYDAIIINEFPDAASAAKVKVAYEQGGLMDLESFEVFNPQEWAAIIEDATS